MTRILFVCHGNICRSPMAEFMMKKLVADNGTEAEFEIASAAVSAEELGNPVYPPARRILADHGISTGNKTARQMNPADYSYYDLLICMDNSNLRRMKQICGGDPDDKMYRLMDFTDTPGEVSDPWYSGDFQTTWDDISRGLQALLEQITP